MKKSVKPLISVIVPVYNAEQYIYKCLDSLMVQTYSPIEFILIDDGSPDNCGEICDEYEKKDKRFKAFHQSNQGVAQARNHGLEVAQGKYIGFVDSDDWVEPNMFEELYNTAEKYDADISICGMYIHHMESEDWIENRSLTSIEGVLERDKAIEYLLHPSMYEGYMCNKLYSVNVMKKAGKGEILKQDPNIHIAEDLVYAAKCMMETDNIAYTSTSVYHYILHEGSALRSYGEKRKSEMIARQQLLDMLEPYNQHLYNCAKIGYVEALVNLVRFATRDGRKDEVPELKRLAKIHMKEYMKNPIINFKSKFRAVSILYFTRISDKIWLTLKKQFHLSWYTYKEK